jgi:hypothetical protein
MVTFASFNNRLPDPTLGVGIAGNVDNTTGTFGPGFASVTVSSNRPVQVSRTVSGRGVQTETGAHFWEITIDYHPMKRNDFDVVSTFLDGRNGKLNPFYVVLPQYSKPKDATFATFCATHTMSVNGAHVAGSSVLNIDATATITGTPLPGDFITITDSADVNHQKAYKITAVETNALYQTGTTQPSISQMRLHIMPELTRATADNAVVNFLNPQFRVYQKSDVLQYALDTNNTYQFQLQLEEILI